MSTPSPIEVAQQFILDDLEQVQQKGVPGAIACFGDDAFSLLVTPENNAIAAAAFLGKGRVVAIAHDGYIAKPYTEFVERCVRWVGQNNVAGDAGQTSTGDITFWNCGKQPFDIEKLHSTVVSGGGAIIASCPWGWSQLNGNLPVSKHVANPFLLKCGMLFINGYYNGTSGHYKIVHPNNEKLKLSTGSIPRLLELPLVVAPIPHDPSQITSCSDGKLDKVACCYGKDGWWCPVSSFAWIVFRFPRVESIARVETYCSNADACPKMLIISIPEGSDPGGATGWAEHFSFPYPTHTCPAGGNKPLTLPLDPPLRTSTLRLELRGIYHSHYMGVNEVTFHAQTRNPACLASAAAALAALPDPHRSQYLARLRASGMMDPDPMARGPTPSSPLHLAAGPRDLAAVLSTMPGVPVPGVDAFPGRPAPGHHAARVVRAGRPGGACWVTTRLYAEPGAAVTARVVEGGAAAARQWRLLVGCHTDDLAGCGAWKRWPRVTQEAPLADPACGRPLQLTPRFGGLVFLRAATADAGDVAVEIGGCVAAPHATAEGYEEGPAPWGEVEGERVSMCLPREVIERHRSAIPAALRFWDAVVASHHELASPPYGRRKERVVADCQISCGYMHSGYPIMVQLDFAQRALDADRMAREGDWGLFHELGHNMQESRLHYITVWGGPEITQVLGLTTMAF